MKSEIQSLGTSAARESTTTLNPVTRLYAIGRTKIAFALLVTDELTSFENSGK
jgi:hypothetical protein